MSQPKNSSTNRQQKCGKTVAIPFIGYRVVRHTLAAVLMFLSIWFFYSNGASLTINSVPVESAGEATLWLILAIFVMVLLLSSPIIIPLVVTLTTLRRLERQSDLRDKTVVIGYSSPDRLSPAQLGFLYNNKITTNEMRATIIDLCQRDIVSIDAVGEVGLKKTNIIRNLPSYEQLAILVYLGGTNTLLDYNQTFSKKVRENIKRVASFGVIYPDRVEELFKESLYRNLINGGYFKIGSERYYKNLVKNMIITICVSIAIVASIISIVISDLISGFFILFFVAFLITMLLPIVLPIAWVVAKMWVGLFARVTHNYSLGTDKLKDFWPSIKGYRDFLVQTEAERISFELKDSKRISNEHLPYALALDIEIGFPNDYLKLKRRPFKLFD